QYPPFFYYNNTPTTYTHPLSLHDALPIWKHVGRSQQQTSLPRSGSSTLRLIIHGPSVSWPLPGPGRRATPALPHPTRLAHPAARSEEHTSELQSLTNLVCRLLLEKKNHPN